MDTEEIQRKVEGAELAAEELLGARAQLVRLDETRNKAREALTALRRQARTSKSSVVDGDRDGDGKCSSCGESDGRRPVWRMLQGADVFVRLPFHQVHCDIENVQRELESNVKQLQSVVKEKTFELSEKGALGDIVSPSLVESFVNLKAG